MQKYKAHSISRNNVIKLTLLVRRWCFTDTTTDKLLSTTADRDETLPPRTVTSRMTSPTTCCDDTMLTSLCNSAGALRCMHRSKMAATRGHGTFADLLPSPMHDLNTTSSNPTLFPFPVFPLWPRAVGNRRAWNSNLNAEKESLNTATMSLMNSQFLRRLPWQPPLCCLLQPELTRRGRSRVHLPVVGDALATSRQQRVTLRRDSPVNWLLSDDAKMTSSVEQDRVWNSPVDRRAAQDRAIGRNSDKHVPPTPCSSAAVDCVVTDRKLTCRHCGKPYASLGALKMHIRTHTLPCRCQLCGKAFSRPWLLQGHLRTHTGERPFACPQCGRAFADRSNLRAHLQTHAELKKYACDRCTKTFSRLSLLVKHRNGPAICGAASSSSSWRR